jgi:hypothetical protein
MTMTQYVILYGDLADGFSVVGPFEDGAKAQAYLESDPENREFGGNGAQGLAMPLYAPAQEEEPNPYADFEIDEKVWVRSGNGDWRARHFAGFSGIGKPLTFDSGRTSFSNPSSSAFCTVWDEARKASEFTPGKGD